MWSFLQRDVWDSLHFFIQTGSQTTWGIYFNSMQKSWMSFLARKEFDLYIACCTPSILQTIRFYRLFCRLFYRQDWQTWDVLFESGSGFRLQLRQLNLRIWLQGDRFCIRTRLGQEWGSILHKSQRTNRNMKEIRQKSLVFFKARKIPVEHCTNMLILFCLVIESVET